MSEPSNKTGRFVAIGLCGGIGSGKSLVADMLRQRGCFVTDADHEVRLLLNEPEVVEQLRQWWGDGVVQTDPTDGRERVDRRAVAEIVFADPKQRWRLEVYIHPIVEARRRNSWAQAMSQPGSESIPAFVIDAPLLFEAGIDSECDAVIFVEADAETRLDRVKKSRGWDEKELKEREKSQWALDTKRQRSDYVVGNNGNVETLKHDIESVLDRILADHSKRTK